MNAALARYRYILFLIIGLALTGTAGYGLVHRPPPLAFTVLPPQPTALPTPIPTTAPIRCHVAGAVNTPGVYTLPPGAQAQDALEAAGGPTAGADLQGLNLAAVLQDQQQIVIPRQQTVPGSESPSILENTNDDNGYDTVNINTADSETLQTLPGNGPAMATKILAYRDEHGPFATVDDLTQVSGIGQATLEKLRPLITIGP